MTLLDIGVNINLPAIDVARELRTAIDGDEWLNDFIGSLSDKHYAQVIEFVRNNPSEGKT